MNSFLRTRTAAASAGAMVALLLAGGGYAIASAAGGTITACVHKHGGGLYVGRCARHDGRLTWEKAGPRGPQGQTGSQGPQGPQGLPGAGGGGTGLLQTGAVDPANASMAEYYLIGTGDSTPVEANARVASPVAFTAKGLTARLASVPGNGGSYTLTLLVNGAATAVACTVTDPATTCADTTDQAAINAGDLLDLRVAPSSAPAPANSPIFITLLGTH
jgi:hypothetical protein